MTMTADELAQAAQDHLWLHFSRLAGEGGKGPTVIERGQGAYVWDAEGNRYLDGLAGLFVVNAGHGREEIARAAASQGETLGYFPLWTYAHPAAIELSARLARMAPGDLNRVFLTTGGAEAVDTAWKLARQYWLAMGYPDRVKVIARNLAYHGATLSTLNITGLDAIKEPFLPLLNGQSRHVGITNSQSCPTCHPAGDGSGADGVPGPCTAACAEEIERMIVAEGPETVAAVFLEPVQNAGGCFVPGDGYFQRVREICDTHGVLLVSDEVICAFGRLGDWFGSSRLGYQPDMLTFAKGVTSGYAPLGGVLISDAIAEPFLEPQSSFLHGVTFGGHPVSCAVALANLDVMEREGLPARAQSLEGEFRSALDDLLDLPIVREVRGMGFFYGIEMTKGGDAFTDDEAEWLLRGFLSNKLLENGLICRADDRGDPVIQLAPPLVSGPEEFDAIAAILRETLLDAWKELEER